MFGASPGAAPATSIAFTSQAAADAGVGEKYGLGKRVVGVRGTRNIGKADMVHNDALPNITVDPETFEVVVDGEVLSCAPAETLPLAQRYFLF